MKQFLSIVCYVILATRHVTSFITTTINSVTPPVVVAPSSIHSTGTAVKTTSATMLPTHRSETIQNDVITPTTTRRDVASKVYQMIATGSIVVSTIATGPLLVQARLEPVNKPELLPTEAGLNVIQTERFLTKGEVNRMNSKLSKLERDTGWRVRVLCQSYPMTPGLAIREYWSLGYDGQKDDKYVVLVVDQFGGKGNVLNFNVGEGLRLALANNFWTQLRNKYGTTFYIRENGVDTAVMNAVDDIVQGLYDASREMTVS